MTPKLIALDLDGTLLNSQGVVSRRTKSVLMNLKQKGVKIVICTGRPPRHTREIALDLGLESDVITFNGAAFADFAKDELTFTHQLSRDIALEALRLMREHYPQVMMGMETHHGWYLDGTLFALREPFLIEKNLPLPDGHGELELFMKESVVKLLFRHPDVAAWDLAKPLNTLDVYATWSHASMLEIMHPKVNKQNAVALLASRLGIAQNDVAAFGDQFNDKELIEWAGTGVAVGNAISELKDVANVVTRSHDEDGVAEVLEQWH